MRLIALWFALTAASSIALVGADDPQRIRVTCDLVVGRDGYAQGVRTTVLNLHPDRFVAVFHPRSPRVITLVQINNGTYRTPPPPRSPSVDYADPKLNAAKHAIIAPRSAAVFFQGLPTMIRESSNDEGPLTPAPDGEYQIRCTPSVLFAELEAGRDTVPVGPGIYPPYQPYGRDPIMLVGRVSATAMVDDWIERYAR